MVHWRLTLKQNPATAIKSAAATAQDGGRDSAFASIRVTLIAVGSHSSQTGVPAGTVGRGVRVGVAVGDGTGADGVAVGGPG